MKFNFKNRSFVVVALSAMLIAVGVKSPNKIKILITKINKIQLVKKKLK